MFKYVLAAAVAGSVVLSSGCVAFRADKLPAVDFTSVAPAPTKTKVFSRWRIETKSSLANDQAKAMAAALHKKYFDDAVAASSCCVLVEGPEGADLVVDGVAHDENNPAVMIPAFITGFSMFIIPSWATATIHISADASRDGQVRQYDFTDSATMVQWLPMIFAMPFVDNPITAGRKLDENTYRNLVRQMRVDGLL